MSSKEENIIAKEQNQKIKYRVVNNPWLDSVVKKKGFELTDITDKGIVTAKLGLKLPKSGEDITVTVWKDEYIGNRLTPWMNFQHRNVMPLLHTESIPSLNSVLIYSIAPDSNLQQKVNSKEFRRGKNSLRNLVMSLIEATQGLNYIQEQGFAHLNVKPSSIALFKDGTIKIDQLHFLNSVNSNSTRNGLPQSLCPPETFYDKETGHKYPQKLDSWAVGIMIVELFTGGYLNKKLPKFVNSWCLQVYPILFKVLKLQIAISSCLLRKTDTKLAISTCHCLGGVSVEGDYIVQLLGLTGILGIGSVFLVKVNVACPLKKK